MEMGFDYDTRQLLRRAVTALEVIAKEISDESMFADYVAKEYIRVGDGSIPNTEEEQAAIDEQRRIDMEGPTRADAIAYSLHCRECKPQPPPPPKPTEFIGGKKFNIDSKE